jgi:arylsulfatase
MPEMMNVVLLVGDALGAGHLGCYGYSRDTSPNLDRLAAEGVLFENYFCSAIPTQPSFTTLFTGLHPLEHGVVSHGGAAQLGSDVPTMPGAFLKAGYTTCAVDNLMRERLWFGRGWEYYIDPSQRRILSLGVTCEELNRRAIPFIRNHADEPFLLFVHYWDPHTPYAPPDKYRQLFYDGDPVNPGNRSLDEFWRHPFGRLARDTWLRTPKGVATDADYVTALYDQEIRHLDDGIAQVVSAIDEAGIGDRTLIVVTGDHGESMTEHGIFYEHHGLYDCVLRIPLILRLPGTLSPRRVESMFPHQDLAPSLLAAAGLPVPRTMKGLNLWRCATGEAPDQGHSEIVSCESTLQAKWSLRTRDYKFILAREADFYGTPPRELYNLRTDPGENRNIAAEMPALATQMESQLEAWIAAQLQRTGRLEDPLREQGISLRGLFSGVY